MQNEKTRAVPSGGNTAVVLSSPGYRSAAACADPYLEKDALRITSLLSSSGFTVHLLLGDAATATQFLAVLSAIAKGKSSDKILVFIFAPGRINSKGDHCLLLYNSTLRDENTWLRMNDIGVAFNKLRSSLRIAFILSLDIAASPVAAARVAQRKRFPSAVPKGTSCGFVQILTRNGKHHSLTSGIAPAITHGIIIALSGHRIRRRTIRLKHLIELLQSRGLQDLRLPHQRDAELVIVDSPQGHEKFPTASSPSHANGNGISGALVASAVINFVIIDAPTTNIVGLNKFGASFAKNACAEMAGISPDYLSSVPVLPMGPSHGEHWVVSTRSSEAETLLLSICRVHESVTLVKCWDVSDGTLALWFASDSGIKSKIRFAGITGPFTLGSARVDMSPDILYQLESTVRDSWPVCPPMPANSGIPEVCLLTLSRYDVSLKDLGPSVQKTSAAELVNKLESKDSQPTLLVQNNGIKCSSFTLKPPQIDTRSSSERRKELETYAAKLLENSHIEVEEVSSEPSDEEDDEPDPKPTIRKRVQLSPPLGNSPLGNSQNNVYTPLFTPIQHTASGIFGNSSPSGTLEPGGGITNTSSGNISKRFETKQVLPNFGEKQPKLDFLKMGDKISLMSLCSEEGLLSSQWYGDVCYPCTRIYFGKSSIPRNFENCSFQIERSTDDIQFSSKSKGHNSLNHNFVAYGDVVRLVNVLSSRNLCVQPTGKPESPYRLALLHKEDTVGSETCLSFKFTPASNMRVEGEKVRVGDSVDIVSSLSNCLVSGAPGSSSTQQSKSNGKVPENMARLVPIQKNVGKRASTDRKRNKNSNWMIGAYHIRNIDDAGDTGNEDNLHTGHPVLLFHKESEGFLTADVELPDNQIPCLSGDLSNKRPDRNVAKAFVSDTAENHTIYYDIQESRKESSTYVVSDFPHSSNAIWLIEGIDPTRGGPVHWLHQRKAYRIKHVATSGYLCVSESQVDRTPKLTIVNSPDNCHTVVVFYPVNAVIGTPEEAGMLVTSSYCRIQFAHSRLWLHIDGNHGDTLGSSATSAVTRAVKVSVQPTYDAVFAIRLGSKLEFEKLTSICSMRRDLGKCISSWIIGSLTGRKPAYKNRKETLPSLIRRESSGSWRRDSLDTFPKIIEDTTDILTNLIMFGCMTGDQKEELQDSASLDPFSFHSAADPDKQHMLFSQNIHLWVLKAIQVPFQMNESNSPDQSPSSRKDDETLFDPSITHIYKLCYHLLKEMVRGQPALALRLSPFIPFIESQLSYDINAMHTLVQIYKGNYRLLCGLSTGQLESYMRPSPFLELLSCSCVSSTVDDVESGIQRNQNIIMSLLEKYSIVFPTRTHKGQIWIKPSKELLSRKPNPNPRSNKKHAHKERKFSFGSIPVHKSFKHVKGKMMEIVRSDSSSGSDSSVIDSAEETDDDVQFSSDDEDINELLKRAPPPSPPPRRGSKELLINHNNVPTDDDSDMGSSPPIDTSQRQGWKVVNYFITHDNIRYINHFQGTLMLFSMLCVDCDPATRSKVSKEISFKEALIGIFMDFKSPECDSIRTAYATIARYLYIYPARLVVGSPPQRIQRVNIQLDGDSHNSNSSKPDSQKQKPDSQLRSLLRNTAASPTSSEGSPRESKRDGNIRALKGILSQILKENQIQVTECTQRNALLTEVFKLILEMLRGGLYKPSEIKDLLPSVLGLLDPATDVVACKDVDNPPYKIQLGRKMLRHSSMWLSSVLMKSKMSRKSVWQRSPTKKNLNRTFPSIKRKQAQTLDSSTAPTCSKFDYNEMSTLVMQTKTEACRLLTTVINNENVEGYNFRRWMSEIEINGVRGYTLLSNILLEVTLYQGSTVLFTTALDTLYRALSETLGRNVNGSRIEHVSEVDQSSVDAMARLLSGNITEPRAGVKPPTKITNLFKHLREVSKADHLCVALLRTFTTVLKFASENEITCADGEPLSLIRCQNALNKLGFTIDLAILIEGNPDGEVVRHALECGTAMLEGGNKHVQESLYNYFLARDDEVLFLKLINRLRTAMTFVADVEQGGTYQRTRRQSIRLKKPPLTPLLPRGDAPSFPSASLSFGTSSTASRRRGDGILAANVSFLLSGKDLMSQLDANIDYQKIDYYKSKNLFHTREVMRYLQLFCEGHNTKLQNYLRVQGDNVHSFNLVSESLTFLECILQVEHMDEFMAGVVLQTFDSLTEYCQGPVPENQVTLVNGGVCLAVTAAFQGPSDGGVDFSIVQNTTPELVEKIRTAAVATVLSLLEGVTDKAIAEKMLSQHSNVGLDVNVFRSALADVCEIRQLAEANEDTGMLEYALELGFSIYILFKTLHAYIDPSVKDFVDDVEGTSYFAERTGRIEICRGIDLERVYFRIPEICVDPGLSNRTKYQLLWSVRRNTPSERIVDFFEKGDYLVYEVEYTEKWFQRNESVPTMLLQILTSSKFRGKSCRTLCRRFGGTTEITMVYLAIFVNFLIICQDSGMGKLDISIQIVAGLQIALLSISLASFSVTEVPQLAYRRYRELVKKRKFLQQSAMATQQFNTMYDKMLALQERSNSITATESSDEECSSESEILETEVIKQEVKHDTPPPPPHQVTFLNSVKAFLKVDPRIFLKAVHNYILEAEDPEENPAKATIQICITTPTFYYYGIMMIFALAGFFIEPLFLSVHLISIARASDVLHNVIRAVTQNGKALILTCILGMVVIYLFSVVAYIFFQDALRNSEGDRVCDSLIHCFMYALTHGVRSDGGLGDHMADPHWSSGFYGMQMAFEVLFFVLVIVILLNIIFGIIIDTFAELRSQRQSVEEDIRTKCFICGIESSEFDRHAEGFQRHIKEDHNMWNYVFFLHHLRLRDTSEYTGQESYVAEKVKHSDLSFFPLNKALAVDHKKQEEDGM